MRKLIWVKTAHSQGWACSECAWAFNPRGPLRGTSIDEMKQIFERERDKEFATHVCSQNPRTKSREPKDES